MRKQLRFATAVLLMCFSLRAGAQVLGVPEVIQEQTEWCWAATTKCILGYYGIDTTQCAIAEYNRNVNGWHDFGSVNCCVNPNAGCNYWNYNWGYYGSMEDILDTFGNILTKNYGKALSRAEIQAEIDAGRPFTIRWGWVSGGGHFMTGHGFSGDTVHYMNSLPGYGYEMGKYSWMVVSSNHTWTHSQTLCMPAIPAGISGNNSICENTSQTYAINAVPGASSYTWTLPAGWTGASTDTSIAVIAASSGGTISVSADNYCGKSKTTSLHVLVNPALSSPSSISGNTGVCRNSAETYFINPVPGATSYLWTLPQGWAGASTANSITVMPGDSGGTISVIAMNDCDSSSEEMLPVTVSMVDTSVSVNGNVLTANAPQASYQWLNCPGMSVISGEEDRSFAPLHSGSYAVAVTQGNCTDTSACYQVLATSIASFSSNDIEIYPNPASASIFIKWRNAAPGYYRISLINALGKEVSAKDMYITLPSMETSVNMEGFSKGIYFLHLSSGAVSEVFKIQKQ